jgi:hypothetical protein
MFCIFLNCFWLLYLFIAFVFFSSFILVLICMFTCFAETYIDTEIKNMPEWAVNDSGEGGGVKQLCKLSRAHDLRRICGNTMF